MIVITGKSAAKINRNLRVNGVECGKAHLEYFHCVLCLKLFTTLKPRDSNRVNMPEVLLSVDTSQLVLVNCHLITQFMILELPFLNFILLG